MCLAHRESSRATSSGGPVPMELGSRSGGRWFFLWGGPHQQAISNKQVQGRPARNTARPRSWACAPAGPPVRTPSTAGRLCSQLPSVLCLRGSLPPLPVPTASSPARGPSRAPTLSPKFTLLSGVARHPQPEGGMVSPHGVWGGGTKSLSLLLGHVLVCKSERANSPNTI